MASAMKFVLYSPTISPHQIPMVEEMIRRVGLEECRYVYSRIMTEERRSIGWSEEKKSWMLSESDNGTKEALRNAQIVISGIRNLELFKDRSKANKITIYTSERWFKPSLGILRLIKCSYIKMAIDFVRLLREAPLFYYYPIGIHAAADMARLCGLVHGDLSCLFKVPELDFDHRPGGKVWLKDGGDGKKYCLDKMRMWGYYVEPSRTVTVPVQEVSKAKPQEIKVLWVGRLLNLKRVDTIVRAVGEHASLKRVDNLLPKITLDIYGFGPEETKLRRLAAKYGDVIKFYPPVPISEVRRLMREHDVYVLSSNEYEGWGAVVSEALEEGMKVVGTYEAGSSATILPESNLFNAGDWKGLLNLFNASGKSADIGNWNAEFAARWLVENCNTENMI